MLTLKLHEGGRSASECSNTVILSGFVTSECVCFIFSRYPGDSRGLFNDLQTPSRCVWDWSVLMGKGRAAAGQVSLPLLSGISCSPSEDSGCLNLQEVKASLTRTGDPVTHALPVSALQDSCLFIPPSGETRANVGKTMTIFHLFSVINERGFPPLPPQRCPRRGFQNASGACQPHPQDRNATT